MGPRSPCGVQYITLPSPYHASTAYICHKGSRGAVHGAAATRPSPHQPAPLHPRSRQVAPTAPDASGVPSPFPPQPYNHGHGAAGADVVDAEAACKG
eukprot:scaffold12231_cov103-Isochrysis_galbana.AAC.7